jgi:hypothetical protein
LYLFIESRKELGSFAFDETSVEPTFLFPDEVFAELLDLFLLEDASEATRDFDRGLDAPPRTSIALAVLAFSTGNDAKSPDALT